MLYADNQKVALIESPQDGYHLRMQLIAEAKERISLCYYEVNPKDEMVQNLFALLIKKSKEGVFVEILLDAVGGDLGKYGKHLGDSKNIQLYYYNENLIKKGIASWHLRMHDKFMIIDNSSILVGGRNLQDRFFALPSFKGKLALDRELLISNPSPEFYYSFYSYFEKLLHHSSPELPAKKIKDLFPKEASYNKSPIELMFFPIDKIQLHTNPTDHQIKEPLIFNHISTRLLDAQKSIIIQSPYIIINPQIQNLFNELSINKSINPELTINILTNSSANSPNLPAFSHYLTNREKIASLPFNLWEYQGTHSLHAKSYIIDDRYSFIGCFNLDPRSINLNTEYMISIDDEAFALHFKSAIQKDMDNALRVQKNGEYYPNDLVKANKQSFSKQFLFSIMKPISKFFTELL